MTDEQIATLEALKERWQYVSKPYSLIGGDDVVLVTVSSKNAGVMTIGIEPDGHAHS